MQIQAQKPNRKPLIIILAVALLLIIAGIAFYASQQTPKTDANLIDTANNNPLTEEEKQQAEDQKDASVPDPSKESPTTPPATNSNITVAVNRNSQMGIGQPLNIRATVTGTSNGTCEVTLTKSGQPTITKSFPIVYDATTATCGAADIPASDFPVAGQWQLQVVGKSSTGSSSPAISQVTITK